MTLISLDIGFDREALPKNNLSTAAGEPCASLRYGFTYQNKHGNPVALAAMWRPDDRMLLNLWDLTDPSQPLANITEMSLKILFQPAHADQGPTPVNYLPSTTSKVEVPDPPNTLYEYFRVFKAVAYPEGYSTVFTYSDENSQSYPVWVVHPPTDMSSGYPANQLEPGRQPPRSTFVCVAAGGCYYFTIELRVLVEGGDPKYFRVDPEMVVENVGAGEPAGR